MFVDKVQATFAAGDGGNGLISFRREKFVDRGGPNGGDGGDGGDIILVASRNQNTLAAFRYQKLLKAENGKSGARSKKHGKTGKDLLVPVPIGTVVLGDNDTQLFDLISDGQQASVAKGGKGGFGNAHFTSSTRQAPRVAEKGEKGEKISVTLELKMIADVGLVGLPNAGKSTLLSVVSNARPEIADYPFTTLIPNLGVVDIDKRTSLLMADIPGLIEGASKGKGLGDEFLRHIERTSVIVHLIDIYNEDLISAYQTIAKELKDYKINLSQRPQIVVLNKVEGLDKKTIAAALAQLQPLVSAETPLMAVSAQGRQGLKELLYEIKEQVKKAKTRVARKKRRIGGIPVISLKPREEDWFIDKANGDFTVTGKKIERFAIRTRFEDYYGRQRLRDIMTKMGIMAELEKQGIEPGQYITIGHPPVGKIEY